MNFSIFLPTRQRPGLAKRLLESIRETTFDSSMVEIIIYMDDDDTISHDIEVEDLNIIKLIKPQSRSMGEIFRDCFDLSSGRYIMFMNDDAVFRTKNWDIKVMETFNKFPDEIAFVYCNDLDQGKCVPTFPILSRKTCELMGKVCPAGYLNLHIESHLIDIFKQLKYIGHDRIVYLKDVIIEHLHYIVSKSVYDKTYIKKDPVHDDRLFISLDAERKQTALKLARYIREYGVKPKVSIIVFGKSNIARCINTILSNKDRTMLEIMAPNSAITQNIAIHSGKVKLFNIKKGINSIAFCNQAAKEVSGDFLIFIGNEIMPLSGWVDAMVEKIEASNDIAVVGCKHINPRSRRIHHAGISFYSDDGRVGITYIYKGVKSEEPNVNKIRDFQAVSGDCMLIRRDTFICAGGFDETLGLMSDIDLCLRLHQRGLRIIYTPDAVVYNSGGKKLLMPSVWEGKVKDDLDKFLIADGFIRVKEGNTYFIKQGT